ncbi:ATP-binding cassette sub- D member 4, partial [Rhizophlyctis rosea]
MENIAIEPILLVYYTYATYQIAGYEAPLLIYTYFITTFFLSKFLLSPLTRLVASRERAEGDLRFLHVNVRKEAESIAMVRGEKAERERLDGAFGVAMELQKRVVKMEGWLKVVTTGIDYVGSMMPYCVIAVPVFAGKYDDLP